MNHVPPRSWAPAQHDLSLPRWAFVAWLTHRRQADGPRPALMLAPAGDIEASLRARLLREVAPQA
jgi:hypothetical protein